MSFSVIPRDKFKKEANVSLKNFLLLNKSSLT